MADNNVNSRSKSEDQTVAERYAPRLTEPQILAFWEQKKIFAFDPASNKKVYSIDTPPPTVSGKMHIGHAFSYTQQDIIARYKRLQGFEVFYPFGTDDNGLPTERLVEKLKKVKGTKMERSAFVKLCQETLKEITPEFVQGWKRIGISCDFNLCYSTINENCQRISQQAFLDLVTKKRAYRKEAPSLWCPQCETAISQVECEDEEKQSTFNDIVFKTAGNESDKKSGIQSEADAGKELIIATTRPEMLSACVAIFAHPDDERYKKLFGTKAIVPIYNHEVPIMPDIRANPEKGTGIVMCCTFGDQTDMEWYRAYNLPLKQAIGKDGKMTELAGQYAGLKIVECRKAIIADLTEQGLIKETKPITHSVNVHERCGTPIEIIQSKQWFIKYLDLKEDLLKWGAELKWHPEFMKSRYDNWVKGLQWDWLISRQRFFGIPFPVWYCEKCDTPVFAEEKNLPVEPLSMKAPAQKCSCGSVLFVPEKDVLDTWATSSLTPQLALSLVDKKYHSNIFPMSLRPQAHDIITFWLFNTMVRSRLHQGVNPWKETVISGFV
ncbi:MAG: valine--tRNA ligase, partial [Candidatus Woesearchaeota archaeon]|nr:valine--tRNA ligase [Candidatus Woesearchaeota archaeon]